MSTAARSPRPLLDEHLAEFFKLVQGADSVELKLTLPEAAQRSATNVLGLDPLEAQIRQVFFFDTPDLALDRAGVVVRGRRTQGRPDDTVVKLRPVDPDKVERSLRQSPEFGIEVDAMPGGYVCSGSLKGLLETPQVKEVAMGQRRLRKMLSKAQRALYEEHAPGGLELDDLSVLGPINVLKLKRPGKRIGGRKAVAELWLYPDGARILELSTKCAPSEALEVGLQARAALSEVGIDLTGAQQTKTRTALRFFSKELRAG
jgi:hypothetical protein